MKLTNPFASLFIGLIACLVIVQANPSNLARRGADISPVDDAGVKRAFKPQPWEPPPFFDDRIYIKRRDWESTWNSFKSELEETLDDVQDIVDSAVSRIEQVWEKFKDAYLNGEDKRDSVERSPADVDFKRADGRRGLIDEGWEAAKDGFKQGVQDAETWGKNAADRAKQSWEKFKKFFWERELENEILSQRNSEEKRLSAERSPADVVFKRADGRRGLIDEGWEAAKDGFKQGVQDAETWGKNAADRAKQGWDRFKKLFWERELENEILTQRFAEYV